VKWAQPDRALITINEPLGAQRAVFRQRLWNAMMLGGEADDLGVGLGSVLVFAPTDPVLTQRPLFFLQAELLRLRIPCTLFDVLAQDHPWLGGMLIPSLLELLGSDLPRHEADLRDLLALLHARLRVGDLVDGLLGQIEVESRAERQAAGELSSILRALAEGTADEGSAVERVLAFAEQERRRLRWQEVALLPLAEQRLVESDLRQLASAFAARRGLRRQIHGFG